MPSPDVIVPALLLPVPVIAIALSAFNALRRGVKTAVLFFFLAILAAVAGGAAVGVAYGEPLIVVAKIFTALLQTAMSGISTYALSRTSTFLGPFVRFTLSLAALLVAFELISTLVLSSPPLLPASLALVSRGILLTLAIATVILLRRRHATSASEMNTEEGPSINESSTRSPARVSSPTPATWPFPASLALQKRMEKGSSPGSKLIPPDLSSTLTRDVEKAVYTVGTHKVAFLPLVVATAQIFASASAVMNIAASIPVDHVNQPPSHVHLVSSACTLLWSFMVLAIVQMLPVGLRPCSSETQVVMGCEQAPLEDDVDKFLRDNPVLRTRKPSFSRRESDSLLDFLSLRDPFASSPPPPPPLPPVALGLDEVDVGWNRSREISMQYRFPAPRSIVKGARRKGKRDHPIRNKRLVHQDSARTLLPVPETRGTEGDGERDKGFGDEARLAQLLLQSLSEGNQDCNDPGISRFPVPVPRPPQMVHHAQQTSRWSTSTTVRSVTSGSVSNRSGISTYTTCGNEKVPTSRISMNTIASVLGSRKSSEAKRKSAITASSSKG